MNSIGTASTTVFDALGPRPSMVCSVRSCMAPGLPPMIVAAAARFSAASLSPSALVMVARFSLGPRLTRHDFFQFLGHIDVLEADAGDMQAPISRIDFDVLLDLMGDLLALGEQFIQSHAADHVAQCALCKSAPRQTRSLES